MRPPLPRFAFLDHDGPIAFAHRGGAGHGTENTLAAFAHAVGLGYRYLETDVNATSDGVLLAFHDRTLDRVTGHRGRVADLPYAAVRGTTVGGGGTIPTLEELLGSWPDVRVNVDVKHASAVGPLVEVVRRTKALDRVCVAAFSEARVAAVRRALGPRLCTALSPRGVARLRAAATHRRLERLTPGGVPCAQVPDRVGPLRVVTPGLVDLSHRRGLHVHVWTVDDAAEMRRLLDLGVDGIMTDQLDTLRDVLITRGQWPTG